MKVPFKLIITSIGLATYNIFYGALCYYLAGFQGVLLGASFMLSAGIIGIIMSYCRTWKGKKFKMKSNIKKLKKKIYKENV